MMGDALGGMDGERDGGWKREEGRERNMKEDEGGKGRKRTTRGRNIDEDEGGR